VDGIRGFWRLQPSRYGRRGPAHHGTDRAGSAAREKVDLVLEDAEVLDALAALAGRAGINIFADPDLNEAGRVSIDVHSAPWRDVLATIASDHRLRVESLDVRGSGQAAFWISRLSSARAPVTRFTGERITAKFDGTPIRDVARTLSAFSKTNIVVDDGVEANITLHLRLPWDLALYHLAQKYGLRIVRAESGLRISRR
jgi:type II secretory pathway component HofQ